MNFIHLVKQVPDITNIPADAWDREKGTLKRNKLDNRMNLLDLHALTLADNIRKKGADDNARIISLTMGPPSAETVLQDSLARAGDDAVLLTDRAFAGADTIATAYSLACGVQKIEKELFKDNKNYIILAGMQSVDGDTAQVPAQISEVLDIDLIAYVTGFDYDADGQLLIKRIGPAGMEVLRPERFPVMLTVTDCNEPLYPSFSRTRQTRLKPQAFHHWTAADIAADPKQIGAKGSKTQVVNIFSFQQTREKTCRFISDFNELPAALKSTLATTPGNSAVEKTETYTLNGNSPAYKGEIWVFAEAHGNEIAPAGLELLNKSRELAAVLNVPVAAILLGSNIEPLAKTLISYGADKVYLVENKELDHFFSQSYKQVITELIKTHQPQIMLFGATPLGRELAPRVAFATGCGLTADCTKLELGERKDQYGILKQTRPALGGNIMATIITKSSPAQMASVRPGVFKAMAPDLKREGEVIKFNPKLRPVSTQLVTFETVKKEVNLNDAEIIIAGGAGMRNKDNFQNYLKPLAEAAQKFLKIPTEIGATRRAVENGWLSRDYQIGQTGQTVKPPIYFAVGISGAVQHISGMQQSGIIIAINSDPDAPIFRVADLGIIGKYEQVIPTLIEKFKEYKHV